MKLVFLISKGIVRDLTVRRTAMFIVVLAALVMLFLGSTFLSGPLGERPVLFVVFWGSCAWLTFLAILLALYDLLAVRAHARLERRRLRAAIFASEHDEEN